MEAHVCCETLVQDVAHKKSLGSLPPRKICGRMAKLG